MTTQAPSYRSLKCPFCKHHRSDVIDSRLSAQGKQMRRRRKCRTCKRKFTTRENYSARAMREVEEEKLGPGDWKRLAEHGAEVGDLVKDLRTQETGKFHGFSSSRNAHVVVPELGSPYLVPDGYLVFWEPTKKP